MASSSRNRSEIEWLYPDLLSKEGLIHILKQRYINKDGSELESFNKESLVALYNQYILPLPQRKYKQHNRLGREMTKRQILHAKKRKISMSCDDEMSVKQARNSMHHSSPASSRGLVNSFISSSPPSNRLKPPPSSCVSLEKKVVQIGSSSKSATSPLSQAAHNGDRKAIKVKSSSSDDASSAKKSKPANDGTVSPSQKGISMITWP